MKRCVKCGAPRPEGAVECPQCGIIYARVEQKRAQQQEAERRAREEQAQKLAQQQAEVEATRAAIIANCPVCGKQISVLARTCPHCGHPIAGMVSPPQRQEAITPPEEKKLSPVMIFGGGFLLICMFFGVIGSIINGSSSDYREKKQQYSQESTTGSQREESQLITYEPYRVKILPNTYGCPFIGDISWRLKYMRAGEISRFNSSMAEAAQAGICEFITDSTVIAFETYMTGELAGAVHVRNSAGKTLWIGNYFVND